MTPLFSNLAPMLAAWLVTYALHSTLLLGTAALVTARMRRESLSETIWKAALVASLLTPGLQLAAGIEPLGGRLALTNAPPPTTTAPPATILPDAPAPASTPQAEAPSLGAPAPRSAPAGVSLPAAPPADPATPQARPSDASSFVLGSLLSLWALVAVALLARFTVRQRRLEAALARGAQPVAPETRALLAALCAASGVRRRVRLAASDACASPLVLPGARVYLPTAFATALDADEQRAALAHELAHVARRDPEWMLVTAFAGCVGWMQPLHRLAGRRLRNAAEYLSDAWAVQQAGSADGLARGLAKVAAWVIQAGRPLPVGTSAMTEGGTLLVQRVERLLRERRVEVPVRAGVRLALAGLVCVVALGAAPRVAWQGAGAGAPLDPTSGAAIGVAPAAVEAEVIRHPDPSQPLAQRWAWAAREADRRRLGGYWVAYGIERPPRRAGEAIISDTRGFDLGALSDGSTPLGRVLLGAAESPTFPARTALLFHVPDARRPAVFDAVAARTLSISFDARRSPILWLGFATDAESIPHLDALGPQLSSPEMRGEAVDLLAWHATSDLVLPVLDRVLRTSLEAPVRAEAAEGLALHDQPLALDLLDRTVRDDAHVDVRREAAEALASHSHPDALRLIERTIREDPDETVRREAVEALGESLAPDALDRLRALVRASDEGVRREAVASIGERPGPEALRTLTDLLDTETDAAVLDAAVESLGDLPAGAGTPLLVRLAEADRRPEVRSRALETLGGALHEPGAGRDAAFAALERVALRDRAPEARRAAVEALGEGRDARSRTLLRRIARDDPDETVREEARDALE